MRLAVTQTSLSVTLKLSESNIAGDSVDSVIWLSLCRRLVLSVTLPASGSIHFHGLPALSFPSVQHLPFEGIISFLTGTFGGDVESTTVGAVTSSGDGHNHGWQVADHGWAAYMYCNTTTTPNLSISFDFGDRTVRTSHYTLKSQVHARFGGSIEGANLRLFTGFIDFISSCAK
jgi:hypothetical protein